MTAVLVPVQLEVGRTRHSKPTYVWVEGYQVITPDGRKLFPYMQKRDARAFCKSHGWGVLVQQGAACES